MDFFKGRLQVRVIAMGEIFDAVYCLICLLFTASRCLSLPLTASHCPLRRLRGAISRQSRKNS